MGPKKWDAVKVVTREKYVKGTLFDIHPSRAPRKLLQFRDIRLKDVVIHVYDRFIGAWGIFL